YAIDRVQPGISAERLAAMPERRRSDLMGQAIEENIVPAELRERIQEAVRPTPPTGDGTAPVTPPPTEPTVEYPHAPTRIADLGRAGVYMTPTLQTTLHERGFETLADVRKAGGLGAMEHVTPELRRTLESHIDLDRVSPDVTTNASLIEAGYN